MQTKRPLIELKELTTLAPRIQHDIDRYLQPSQKFTKSSLEKYCLRLIKLKNRAGVKVNPDQERARMLAQIVILRKKISDLELKLNTIQNVNYLIASKASAIRPGMKRRVNDWRLFGSAIKSYYEDHGKLPSKMTLINILTRLDCHYQEDAIDKNLGDAKRILKNEGSERLWAWLSEPLRDV